MEFDIGRLHRWAKAVAAMATALSETTHLNADKLENANRAAARAASESEKSLRCYARNQQKVKILTTRTMEEKMTTEEVAKEVVELVRKQAWYEALDTLYDNDIMSVEATAPESRGKEAVRGKIDWWVNAMQVHSFKSSEPFVAHDRFVVQYEADVTDKESKKRRKISEVGVYTVKNSKIVREEFLPRMSD